MSCKLILANIAAIAILFCASAAQPASFMISGKGTPTKGVACTGASDGYGNTCRSGTCDCFALPTGKVTGSFKGSAQVFATADKGIDSGEPPLECKPVFMTATVTNTGRTKTVVLDITAAQCKNGSITGAWGASSGGTGSGAVSGSANKNTGRLAMTLKGAIH